MRTHNLLAQAIIDVYEKFQIDLLEFEKDKAYSGMANHVRAKARFLVSLDDVLDLSELRTRCIHDVRTGVNPTISYVRYYLHKPAKDHDALVQRLKVEGFGHQVENMAQDLGLQGASSVDSLASDNQTAITHCDCTRKAELASGHASDVPLQPGGEAHEDRRPAMRRTQEEIECMAAISSLLERATKLHCTLGRA